MEFVTKSRIENILKNDALAISKEASSNPNAINATIGTFLPLKPHEAFIDVLNNLTVKERFYYSSVDGGPNFALASNQYLGLKDHFVLATPGGTGALSCSVSLSLEKGETLLIPYPCWGPYFGIGQNNGLNVETYNIIKDDHFDMEDFTRKANQILSKQESLAFILNDPCQNPTGYTLSKEELQTLIEFLNNTNRKCTLIYDIAYLDMEESLRYQSRRFLDIEVKDNVNIIYCISYSKSYQIYGGRLGALVTKDENFYKHALFYARNTWSNSNHEMISLIEKIELNPDLKEKQKEISSFMRSELKKRSQLFLKEAKEVGLKTLKYEGGFFISIPVENNKEIYDKLKNEGIYLLPVCNVLRVAICGLKEEEIKGLAKKIKKYI